jgi:tetratricopeptide (TPR) repeat protein
MELLSSAGESERALLAYEGFKNTLSRELQMEPSSQMQQLAARLQEEVEQRASLGASLILSAATPTITTQLSALEVPLVGRHEEFGVLVSEYLGAREEGESRVVVLLGEAGIGKTRLAEEFLGWAKARGADVLKGEASDGAGLPYGPLVEAIRPRIEKERAPDDLLEDAWLSELSRLLPELKERYSDLPTPTSGGGETAKGALFEAIARTVGALASRAPVVLFLDDLQWADTTTLEVLDYAGRRWVEQGAPVVVLIAARPEEPEGRAGFERWLLSLGRRLPVRSLALGPLGNEDVEGLLRGLARAESSPAWAPEQPGDSSGAQTEPERFVARLLAETGGQPFYLVETLKALLEVGMLLIRSRPYGEQPIVEVGPALRAEKSALRGLLPQSVREVIRSRLSRLSPAAYELLRAGAVLERGFGFETVVGVAGLEEAEGLRALDELIERHLLLEEAGGREEEDPLSLYPGATYTFSHEKIRQVAYTEAGHARRQLLHYRAFEVLEESGTSPPPAQLARHALAGGLAEQAFRYSVAAGDQEHARPLAEKALASARALVGRPDLIARSLWTLARVEMDAGRLEESAAYAEESAALSRELAERPAPWTLLPSMLAAGSGLVASWRAGTKAMEIRCLSIFAYDRIWQGRLREGIKIGREALAESRELPERAEAMGMWGLGLGLVETGEYEEGLELCRRGTELARKLPNVFLLWHNLDNLGRAYETLLDLQEARRAYEEALQLRGSLGPRYEKFSSIKLCAVAVLSENWEEAYAYALRAREVGTFFNRLDMLYLHHQVEALLRGGDERLARENVRRFADRAEVNERNRISYLRSLAALSEWEGNTQRVIDHLHEAQTLAEKIGLPGELWQIRSRIGELHERRGEAEQAREAFSIAAQTLRMLAQKIADEGLRERYLSAPQVRRVLEYR